MQTNVKDIVDTILKNVPGIIGAILIDSDGSPIYVDGRFDISPAKLGAMAAVCYACSVQVGNKFGESMSAILTEYESIKLYHIGLAERAQLIILTKTKDAQLGMLKVAATKATALFSQSLNPKSKACE